MDATASRLEFAPPPSARSLRALGLAVIAHALLLAALTWGVRWKNEPVLVTAEAELWSAVPQQAAPRLVEVPVPPAPAPKVRPVAPAPPKQAAPDAPQVPDAKIVIEREKRRLAQEKLAEEKLLQAQKAAKLEKQATEKKRLEDKRELDKKQVEDKKKTELALKRKEAQEAQEDAKRADAQRQENIKRMTGLAGASGAPDATGAALKSSGPSEGYGARLRARIKPNIVFTEDISGNPTAEVEVVTAPDGTITKSKLLKSSGVPAWDRAVLKAIDKTETLPRDVDGRVPPSLVITFRPKD
jgi:colicin import membrane protein